MSLKVFGFFASDMPGFLNVSIPEKAEFFIRTWSNSGMKRVRFVRASDS